MTNSAIKITENMNNTRKSVLDREIKKQENIQNLPYDIGNIANDFTGQNAAMDRQYQQNVNIAKHQYQWAVEDMQKAGLNPAMIFGGGGGHTATANTSIGGATNLFSQTAGMINSTTKLVNAFNQDKDRSNNANVADIIKLINLVT